MATKTNSAAKIEGLVRGFFDRAVSIIVQEDDEYSTYKGMRLIAIDGSTLALENSHDLLEKFGSSGRDNNAATARCSIAFDPLNKIIYDGQIGKYEGKDTGERTLAKRHIERLNALGLQGSLLLFDRGYPSVEFMSLLIENGYQFVMRVKKKRTSSRQSFRNISRTVGCRNSV